MANVNRLAKGRRIELLAKKRYEARGWTVYKPPWNRWGEKDIFGVGDLLLARPLCAPRLVQVRVRSGSSESALARDGKFEAMIDLCGCGFDVVLLLWGGKRRKRVPEWEERVLLPISRKWETISPTDKWSRLYSSLPEARPSSLGEPSTQRPAS